MAKWGGTRCGSSQCRSCRCAADKDIRCRCSLWCAARGACGGEDEDMPPRALTEDPAPGPSSSSMKMSSNV
eukprot:1344561-Amphidinium_carterae.1